MRKKWRYDRASYEEHAKAGIPEKAPPPGYDVNLGKKAVRTVYERFVGAIDYDEKKGLFIRGPGRKATPLHRLPSILESYEGFNIELTVYNDYDPDIQYRMAEALEGLEGPYQSRHDESIYAERIRYEFIRFFPGREYLVWLDSDTIQVAGMVGGKRRSRFLLCSPELGRWLLEKWENREWIFVGEDFTFFEALKAMLSIEEEHLRGI